MSNSTTSAVNGNIYDMAAFRDDGVIAKEIIRYLAVGSAAKAVGLDVLQNRAQRDIVAWACSLGHPKGTWVAMGALTLRQSLVDAMAASRQEVSTALRSMISRNLIVLDKTPRDQERLTVTTPAMIEAYKEVEWRRSIVKSVPARELDAVITHIGWDQVSARLKVVLKDPERDLDWARTRDRMLAWEVIVQQSPKAWKVHL